ncbi:MAG: ABC transporter ATP-binding protein [Acetatifactor sp.]
MIQIENVEKRYGDFTLTVSLEVKEGQITGLIGKNGAGKSTTIKAILGLIQPDAGTVTVFGKKVSELQAADREAIGVTMADSGFSNYLTVSDVIGIQKRMYASFDETFFRSFCEKNKLPLNKPLKEFSTGMKVKIKVLSAISHQAKCLILDEPTTGLDVAARNEILDMLRDYMEQDPGRCILITSHISSDLENLCDDVYMIDGKVLLHEDMDVIISQYGILKMDERQYQQLDKAYILSTEKGRYGVRCLTNQRQFYVENYPGIVIENGNIDELILSIGK